MAVLVKDFVWKQTDDHVVVNVPLKGVPPSSVDILTYDTYIKVHFKPFLFEAFLSHRVKESSSRCTILNGEVEFHLEKEEKNVQWDTLCVDLSREEKNKAREEILVNVIDRNQQNKIAKQELLQSLQRKSVQQQIVLETSEKQKVEDIQNTERTNAMEDLEMWKSRHAIKGEGASVLSGEDLDLIQKTQRDSSHIWDENESFSSDDDNQSSDGIQLTKEDLQPIPITRQSGSISVTFTPRAFPTPQRESKIEEEQTWLKKQAAALRTVGFVAEDLRPDECNPQWLKEKGDSFFQVGNYLGAISAYSHGIKLSKDMAGLYVNRSAAHYALGNLQRVIEDCSTALELMTPKVHLNEDSRAKCHVRRGAALCKLGMLRPGLADFEAAFAIKPNDQQLQSDIEEVKLRLQESNEDSK